MKGKKIMMILLLSALILSGCGAAEKSTNKGNSQADYHDFKAKILDYRPTGSDQIPTITVIVDHQVRVIDCKYDSENEPIKVENNNLNSINGAFLYGKISSDGEIKDATIKSE